MRKMHGQTTLKWAHYRRPQVQTGPGAPKASPLNRKRKSLPPTKNGWKVKLATQLHLNANRRTPHLQAYVQINHTEGRTKIKQLQTVWKQSDVTTRGYGRQSNMQLDKIA